MFKRKDFTSCFEHEHQTGCALNVVIAVEGKGNEWTPGNAATCVVSAKHSEAKQIKSVTGSPGAYYVQTWCGSKYKMPDSVIVKKVYEGKEFIVVEIPVLVKVMVGFVTYNVLGAFGYNDYEKMTALFAIKHEAMVLASDIYRVARVDVLLEDRVSLNTENPKYPGYSPDHVTKPPEIDAKIKFEQRVQAELHKDIDFHTDPYRPGDIDDEEDQRIVDYNIQRVKDLEIELEMSKNELKTLKEKKKLQELKVNSDDRPDNEATPEHELIEEEQRKLNALLDELKRPPEPFEYDEEGRPIFKITSTKKAEKRVHSTPPLNVRLATEKEVLDAVEAQEARSSYGEGKTRPFPEGYFKRKKGH